MRTLLVSLICGLIFGTGLVAAGMSDPAKVIGFLDIFGSWDPSLAFVMAGGIAVTLVGYRWVLSRTAPLCAAVFHLPKNQRLDLPLVLGSALFGLGWGLVGLCPGPAFTLLAMRPSEGSIFIVAMLAGLLLGGPLSKRLQPS